ncbi:MAG TPA: serine/threonine-protein kinase [Kofleriaceae bacterium]|nr:serine/threonine-protein kinase [Kofleriaceae bacterium]
MRDRQDATIPRGTADGRMLPLARPDRRRFGARFGDYEVLAPLANGGMGGVYLAAHVTTGERVALKVLDPVFAGQPEVVARLYAEHAVASRAQHRGLVAILDAARNIDRIPYLVMEYLDGETLATIHQRGRIEIAAVIGFAAQIADALAALHAAGVIHCDVKPENLFVLHDRRWREWPQLKVIDFGVSRGVDEPASESIAGTPAYMAPEQWRGRAEPASDVYALGCVLYELLVGDPPFDGSLPQLMLAHLEQRAPRPSWLRAQVPLELERLVLRALAKDPRVRPTMRELAAAFGALAGAPLASGTLRMAG